MHSRLLVPSLLRPFGEHLAALVQPEPGDVCVDVGGAGGVMPALLARVARLCVAVDDDAEVLAELRHRAAVAVVRARGDALPLRDGCAQVVTSLFALPPQPDAAATTLRELLRVLDPQHGRLVCALWTAGDDGTLLAGRRIEDTTPLLAAAPSRTRIEVIRDVARFDGVDHYRAAISPALPGGDVARWTAYDGTLRIPTQTVTLLVSPAR
jgi:SAM-dependent methyltransferase